MKKFKIWAYIIWVLSLWRFLSQAIPAMIKSHNLQELRNEIQVHKNEIAENSWAIDKLSIEWNRCEQIQLSWSQIAEWIRKKNSDINLKINELKIKYNNINGFIEAWQPQ